MTRFHYRCPIRWGDLDAQGHVNNAVVVDYLQEARVEFLLSSAVADLLGAGVVVVAHQVEYLAPIPFAPGPDGPAVDIELWIDQVGAARFCLSYELRHRDTLVGRARTVVTPYDLAEQRVHRLTDTERDVLRAAVEPPVELRALPSGRPGADAFTWPCRVRWADLDSYGHVNNVKFYDYFQEARIAWFGDAWDPALTVLLVRQDVDYVRPVDFRREPYTVRLAPLVAGRTSLTVGAELVDKPGSGHPPTVFARARSVLVCAGPDLQPVEIPDALRARLGVAPGQ